MGLSLFTAAAVVSLAAIAAPSAASASCAKAFAGANAIRGPHYAGGLATAGCGAYTEANAEAGNTAAAEHLDPVGYTHQQATAEAFGGSGDTPTAASALSRANLGDASLHGTTASLNNAFAESYSSFSETLTFTNTTGVNQYLAIGWLVEGASEWASGQSATVIANFGIGTRGQEGIQEGSLGYFHSNGATYDINGAYSAFGWWPEYPGQGGPFGAAYKSYDLGGDSRLMTSLFGIAPGTHVVDVTAFLSLSSSFGASLNYGNTGALLFGALADGVSFTSESGVFRPNALVIPGSGGTAVPEPGAWALMIGGFGLAGVALRRRRSALA